jgi:hypothetical protein
LSGKCGGGRSGRVKSKEKQGEEGKDGERMFEKGQKK